MPQWYDITRSEDYQALSPEEKSQAKTFFFQKNILPNLQGDVELNDDKVIQFAFDEFMAIPDDTGQGYVTSMLGAAGRGFAGVVPGAVTGAGALLGSETIQGAGESLQEGLESLSPVNPLYEDDIAMKGANVLGNVGGIITTGGIGGALGKGLAAERIAAAGTQAARQALTAQAIQRGASSALYGTGFAQGAAQKAQENERLGMEGPEAYLNLIGGGLSEVLPERFGFGTALETSAARRLLGGVDDAAGKVIPGIRMGAAQEALEGGSTQALSNLSTQLTAPQGVETPGLFEGVGEAALWEGVGGAMFGAINKLGRTPPDKQTPEQQQWQSEINATPVDSTPPVTPEESQKNANEGGIPVVTPDGVVSWLPAVSQAINIQGPQPEGMPSDVEQRLSGLMGKPTDPGIVAAENLVAATVEVPNADITAATAADIIAQNEAFVDSMPPPPSKPAVQPVEEVEEAGAEAIPSLETEMLEKPSQTIITGSNGEIAPEMPVRPLAGEAPPSLPETGPPVVDQEAPAVTTVQAAPIQPTQENAPLAITDTESLRQEPQDRVESREAEGAGVSDQLRSPAAGEEEVVAPTRDVTKPEQMTREEYSASNTATLNKVAALRDEMFKKQRQEYEAERTKLQKKRAAALKRISRLNLNGSTEEIDPNTDSASKRIIEGLQKDIKKIDETLFTLMPPIQTKVFDEAAKELGYDKKETHRGVVHDALVARKPVNAAAADAYGYAKLPEGYVKQGDLYVFQPKEFTSGGKQPLQTGSGTGTTRQLQAGKERGETKALESEGISVTAGEYITEDEARAGFQIAVGTLDKGSVAPDSPAILISEKLSKDSDAVKAIYGFPNSVRGVLIQIHLGLPVSIEGDNTQRAFKIASEAPKFFPLAKNYTRQGDLYVFQPGATGEPVQAAPSAAQAAKATAPGPIQKPVTQGQIQAKIQELLRAPTKGTKKPAVSFKTQTEENAFARGFQAATERQGEPPPARMPNRSPKDQKWDEAWYKGWASGQTFVRSLPSPTSIEQLPQTTTVATQTETAAPGPVSPILDDEIRELAKNTYLSLNGTEAGRKLTESAEGVFIGQPSAVDELFDTKRIEAGGFRIKELKQAADDLYASYSTVRDMLRRKFGSKITLYRSQGSGEEGRVIYGKKSTLNWASSPQEASQYDVGSRTLVKKEIPVEDIIVVNVGPKGNYDEFIVFNEEAKPDLPPSALREKSKFAADFQVKRGANFSSDGVYDVNTPEGIRRIFRDSETGAWMDADQKAPVYSPLPFKFLGYSKKEAIEALRKESQTTTVATNETAAPLAKEGEKNLDKIYLNVPFTSKDNAKSLGAKWDKDKKLWFIQKNDNGFMPTVPERWIPDEQSVIRDKKELSAAKVNAEAKYNRVVEVVETTVSGSKAFALKFTDGQWLNPNIEKNDQSFQPPSQKENIWTLPIEETEDKIWQQVFARESAKLDAMKKGKRNPKSPYFNIRDSEIEKQQRELERLRNNKNSIGIEWGELVRAFDESLVNGEPISANQEQLFILKRLPREEFLARLKNAGYEQSGETFYPRQSSTGGGAVGQTRINPPSPAGGATQTTAAEKQTPAPSRKGAGAAGASSSLTGGRSGELPPSETQETQPSTGEIPVAERDADSIIGALDVMRNQFRDQAKVKRTLDDEVGRLPKAKLKEVADALGVKAIKDEVVASIMSEPTRTEKVMADIYGKEEEEAEQRESFKEERKRARDSITAKDKPLDERPEVTGQDVAFAKQLVQKEVPAATFATVMTAEEFLASESLTTAFRDIAAGLRAGRIEGVFISSGHVFLFPENIIARQSDIKAAEELGIPVSVAAARRVILHESLVHFGFAGLTDSEQNWLIDWAKRHSTEADIAEVLRKYPRESNEDQATHMLRAFEERLAAIIEKTGKWPTSSAWQELKAFLRRLYNRIMGVADSKPTDKELLNVLRMLQSGSERMLEKSFAKTGLGGNVRLTNKPSYAGEKAEMPQFMRDSLDTAKAMAAAGKDGEEIRSVTGWFSGKYDGKMRWEVPDEGASLLKTETIRAGYPADQVINHRNLFDIYPDLRKVVVAFYPLPNNERGGFDSFGNGRIEIAERLSDEEKLSTLLHEIQHWIQNKEGFSKGGTPQAASRKLAEKSEASQRAKRDFDEAKARYESLKEAAKSKITKERGGLGRLDDLLADLEPNVKKAFDEMLAAKHKASFSPVLEGYKVSDDDAFQGYRSMAGEIEARDVQARQKLTPEQRRATAPYSSENIAKEDAIVMFGGGTQASYSTADEARLAELYQNLTPELPNPAVREAYDRLATTQTQVAISDLRNESALSKEDFAQSLQTLFDNGQAVLSPASSIEQQEADAAEYGVFGHGGTPASFVTVMPETNPQYESRTPIILKAGASTSVGGVGMASISPSDNSARAQAIREGISKTNWNELSTAQRAQALEEFGLKSISSRYFFDAAILPVLLTNERTGENRPASVYVAEPSPAITIQFDASGLSNLLSGDAVTAFTAVYDIAQEEVIHTAQHLNAYAKWQDSGVMLPFEKFEVDYYTSMLLEMVQSASKGLSNGDARVANIIVSAWNLYNPNSPSNDVNRIVEKLAQSNTAPAFTMEVGRQLIQFKRQDFTTETGWMRFVEAMKKYLSDALEALKTSLGLAQSGKAGELLQREIRDVESILDRLESNPNSIIPAKFSLADTSRDAEYLAAVEAGDSGNDNLIQLLKVSPQNERKAVFEAWVKRNPEAAAKAQRTVDEAAKSAGYNVGPVPHGTTAGPFNEFRVPAYFGSGASMYAQADSELVSWNGPRVRVTSIEPEQIEDNLDSATAPQDFSYEELYAGKANGRFVSFGGDGIYRFDGLNATGDYKYALVENLTPVRDNSFNIVAVEDAPPPSEFPRIIRAYLKIQNPAILNAREGSRLAKGPNGSWDQELYDGLVSAGYDGVIADDDWGGPWNKHYIVFSPNQIKSADPVTYDDAGNVIPPSQRFQPKSPDIRFSLNSAQEESENESAKEASKKIKSIGVQVAELQAKAKQAPWQGRDVPVDMVLANHPAMTNEVRGEIMALARKIIESKLAAGIPYEELATDVTKPSFIGKVTQNNEFFAEPMRQALLTEVGLVMHTEAQRLAAEGKPLEADILLSNYQSVTQAAANKSSVGSNVLRMRQGIINHPDYGPLHIANNIRALQAEERRKTVGTNAPGLADEVKNIQFTTDQAAKDVEDAVEDIQERSDEEFAMEAMSDEVKSRWSRAKALIAKMGAIARNLAKRGIKGFKASKAASAASDDLDKFSVEELQSEFKKAQSELNGILKSILGEEAAPAKGTRKPKKTPAQILAIRTALFNSMAKEGLPVDLETAVAGIAPVRRTMWDTMVERISKGVGSKVESIERKPEDKQLLNDLTNQLTRVLRDSVQGEKKEALKESLGLRALRAFGYVTSNDQLVREAWEAARENAVEVLADVKRAELGLPKLKEQLSALESDLAEFTARKEGGNIAQQKAADARIEATQEQIKDVKARIAAIEKQIKALRPEFVKRRDELMSEVPRQFFATSQARSIIREALEDKYDNTKELLDNVEEARQHVIDRLNEAVDKEGNVDPARWDRDSSFIKRAFDDMVADMRESLAKAEAKRIAAAREKLFSATEEEQIRIIQRKLNDLRPEEGGIKIPWDKLAQIRISEQKTLESQMFQTLKTDPAFAGLPDSDLAKLSKIVSKVWQKKRETVIAKELERIEARNDWSKKAKEAVKEHHPKIMRLINARLFDDNALYALIAEEYGFKELTPEQQARAIAITEKFMDPKTPRYVRAALQKEFKDIMMEVRGPTLLQTLNAVWYSSVLSSMRTMITIALGSLNNGLIFIGEAVATVIANPTNPSKWVPILDSIDAIAKNLGPAAVDMWKYLKTGDSVYLDSNILNDPFYADQIKKGVALDGVDVGERMYRTSKNPVTKAIGWHVMVITRLLRVLDGFNTRLGKVSSMPFMYRRLTDEYDSSVVRALTDPAHYREKLIQDGVDPNSPALSALAMHAMHEDWDSQKGLLSNLEQNTNYNGAWSSMTSDPKGAGGILYGSVKMIERFMGTVADTFEKVIDQRLEMMGKQGIEKDPIEDFIVRRLGKPSSYFLNYLASGLLPGLGLGFVRVVGNSLNQAISLIPGVGILRVMEGQDPRQKVAHRALLMRNQAFGIIGLMVMVKALKDIEDEPDDEKRGWGIEGNWEGLTPQQKAALFASGAQPNSFFVYRNGKRVNIRYSEWPLASIFSLTGNISDNIKYRPESWQTASAGSKAAKAVYYMWSTAFTMPAISQAMENLGAPRGSEDPFEAAERRIPKALASFAGGYIPRSIKDLDMWMQSETNRYKGWESLAKEIPFVRRAVGTEYLDVFGKQLETDRAPWSRVFTEGPDDPAYQLLGRLSAKGVWLSPPNPNGKLVGEGSKRREMTPDEGVMYQKEVGKGYRQLVLRYGNRLLQMPEERAKKFASQKAEEVREKATAKIDRIVR